MQAVQVAVVHRAGGLVGEGVIAGVHAAGQQGGVELVAGIDLVAQPGVARGAAVAVAVGVLVVVLVQAVPPTSAWIEADFWTRCLWLAAAVTGGGCTYFAALFAVGFRIGDMRMQSAARPL